MSEGDERLIAAPVPPFRMGTQIAPARIVMAFNAGGIGDYIHWIGAIRFAIDSNLHLEGDILSPPYFYELAKFWLGNYSPRFKVLEANDLKDHPSFKDAPGVIPDQRQYANACGFHLTHLGFIFFTQRNSIVPEYETLPVINGDEVDISRFNLPEKYVVIPTEATAVNRMFTAETLNEITDFLKGRGYTPVFMGKHFLAKDYKTQSASGINLDGVIDLREKTSLLEAACIMAKAKFVIGIDGGLLHLASCSLVTTVFVFTTVHPHYRIPKRRDGAQTIVLAPPESLTCRFCNTGIPGEKNMSYVIGHDFKECLYKDNLCTKMIDGKILLPIMENLIGE